MGDLTRLLLLLGAHTHSSYITQGHNLGLCTASVEGRILITCDDE
jgi:uncharacterized protein with PIN domain